MAIAGLSIRLYLDHNVDKRLGPDLASLGHDVIAAGDVGNARLADAEQLRWAAEHGRVLFTFDRKDFPRLDGEWRQRGESHAGIIVCVAFPKLTYGEMRRRLLRFLDDVTADEIADELRWLDASWSSQDGQ